MAPEGEAPVVDVTLELSSYDFPKNALVRVEAWRSNSVQRWEYGTVGAIESPIGEASKLTDVPTSAQFRVLVVAGDDSGLLLGHAPSIRPVLPRRSLLPVRETNELGDEVWRVDFGDGLDSPELLVNSSVVGISEIVRSDATFRSLVMPEILRKVLHHIVVVGCHDPHDDEGPWGGWFAIARTHLPNEDPPTLRFDETSEEEISSAIQWIDRVVAAFADSPLDAVDVYNATISGR
ncbi:MAG: hypothetical protein F4X41_00440 [Chloroflexi bacterium]|nr:hypothetical protein [Chloroflexota bacterium]